MKKTFSICLLVVCGIIGYTQESVTDDNEPVEKEYPVGRNIVSINPFNFFDGTMQMDYERKSENFKTGINLSLGLTAREDFIDTRFGYNADLQLRHYVIIPKTMHTRDFHFNGMFTGVFGKGGYLEIEDTRTEYSYDLNGNYIEGETTVLNADYLHFSTGVLMGVQFSLLGKLNFETYLGGGIRYSKRNGDEMQGWGVWDPEYIGIIPKAGFKIGVEI